MSLVRFNLNRFDADGNAALDRALAHVLAGTFAQKFPNLRFREFIPTGAFGVPAGARTVVWYNITSVGMAKIVASYSDDLPRADAKLEENVSRIRTLGASFGYSDDELDEAAMSGQPLPTFKSNAARRAVELKHEDIAAKGDPMYSLLGLINQPNALTVTIPAGAGVGADSTWETKDGKEMVADLDAIFRKAPSSTNDVENINTILLTPTAYGLASDTLWDPSLSDDTVLERFQRTHTGIRVDRWNKLVGAGTGGADLAVGFYSDPEWIRYIEPMPFTPKNPQERNLETVVPVRAKSGGVICFFPLSIVLASGI